jgi:hypothetical protein
LRRADLATDDSDYVMDHSSIIFLQRCRNVAFGLKSKSPDISGTSP